MDEGFSPVFNGRLSGLIDLVWQCWGDDLAAMYKSMRDNGLEAGNIFRRYTDYWRQWCENLYNADAMGYANTGHFTKAYGDKVKLMEYFLQKRSRYMDSKFCCGESVVNNLRLRLYETGKGLAIKHYSPMYASVQWGANNFATVRSIDGDYGLLPFGFTNPQNATFDIDDADMVTDLKTFTKRLNGQVTYSGLEGLGDFEFDANMPLLRRLEELIMDYTPQRPNTRERGTAFDLSKCAMLRRVVVRNVLNLAKVIQLGSGVLQEVDFSGTPIKGVVLPENGTLTRLVLPDTIEELTLRGLDALTPSGLSLAGLGNIRKFHYSSCRQLNGFDILQRIYEAGAEPTDITLEGVNETLRTLTMLNRLAKAGAKLTGRIILDGVAPGFHAKLRWIEAWGDIDSPNSPLFIHYEKRAVTSISVSGDFYVQTPGTSRLTVTPDDLRGNTVRSVVWSIASNSYATIHPRTGVLTVNRIGEDSKARAEVSATVTLDGGAELEAHETIYFYQRPVKGGDIIYADGSYSDKLNRAKTPVGACFYLSADGKDRRMMSINRVNWAGVKWGVSQATVTEYSLARLASEPARDLSTVRGLSRTYSTDIDQDFTVLSSPLLGYSAGEKMSTGRYNTLCIVQQRNTILRDSNYNMEVPSAQNGASEYQVLKTIHAGITQKTIAKGDLYYFPASICYAYEPTVLEGETLSDKFAVHNWYLMSVAEAKLIAESLREDYDSDRNFLHLATSLGLIEKVNLSGNMYEGTLETSQESGFDERVFMENYYPRSRRKWQGASYVFAVCNF